MDAGDGADQDVHESLVKLLYQSVLGRDVEPAALKARTDMLAGGVSFAEMFREVATSEEALNRSHGSDQTCTAADPFEPPVSLDAEERLPLIQGAEERLPLIQGAVDLAYTHFLRRTPTVDDMTFWAGVICAGTPVEKFLADIAGSEEAVLKARQREVGAGLSHGEFLMAAGEVLFGRGLTPVETVAWQRRLESGDLTRRGMIGAVVGERIQAASGNETDATIHDPDACSILGTSRMLTKMQWNERADELRCDQRPEREVTPLADRRFYHSGDYAVSMIASLYKGRAFIGKFLENIVSQTLFDRSELIIVDAESPEGEEEIIDAYRRVYPNIVYKRINYRLGIYDAWNVGLSMARGRYITNTNLDDLRRKDSIALQASFLDAHADIDVVYQDFYYSFDPDLDFEDVEAFGFKSELPILTPNNLLLFNSPHNAPMWRKALHDRIGLFDTRYKSAGDYEFWVRCLLAGKSFGKINTPHVVYYQNPTGISTRPDTRGIEEARDVLRRYAPKLTRSALLQSRRDLYAGLGIDGGPSKADQGKSYYGVIQDALIDLGGRGRSEVDAFSHERRDALTGVEDDR